MHFRSGGVDVLSELWEALCEAAAPITFRDNKQRAIARAAARLGIGYRRARAIYHGEVRMVEDAEMGAIRARRRELKRARLQALSEEIDRLRAEIGAMENE
jgi:hypothetical protein